MSNLDPVTLTVIPNGLIQVCNEMDLAFVRAAFSPVISEGMDRSDGIYDAVDGSLIAQGSKGLPVFVGTMQFSTRHLIFSKPNNICRDWVGLNSSGWWKKNTNQGVKTYVFQDYERNGRFAGKARCVVFYAMSKKDY